MGVASHVEFGKKEWILVGIRLLLGILSHGLADECGAGWTSIGNDASVCVLSNR